MAGALVYNNLDLKSFDVLTGIGSPNVALDYSSNNGVTLTSAVAQTSLDFPDNVLSAAYWTLTTNTTINATPVLSVVIDWYLVTPASSAANVRFGAAVAVAPTAGTVVNSLAAPLATAVVQSSAIVTSTLSDPTTFFKPARVTLLLTNGGGNFITANAPALFTVKVFRDGLDVLDTAVGDVKVRKISVVYTD